MKRHRIPGTYGPRPASKTKARRRRRAAMLEQARGPVGHEIARGQEHAGKVKRYTVGDLAKLVGRRVKI